MSDKKNAAIASSKETPPKERYYGILMFVGGIIFIVFYTAVTFGSYFFPEIVHFEVFGQNILYYEFWILITVWTFVMVLCGLFVWLGLFLLIQPLLQQSKREE